MNWLKTLTAAGLFLTSVVLLEARIWTDKSGSHEIEATFVKLEDDQVTLKLADGKLTTLPLGKLSLADQKFVQGQVGEPVPAEPAAGGVAPDVTASAEAELIEVKSRKKGEPEVIRHQMNVRVDLTGDSAAEAFALGEVVFDPAVVGDVEMAPNTYTGGKTFMAINREQTGNSNGHPEDGVRVTRGFSNAEPGTQLIDSLSGHVTVLIGGEAGSVELTGLHDRALGAVENPELEAAGIEMDFERGEPKGSTRLIITILAGMGRVTSLSIVASDGSALSNTSGSAFLAGKKSVYERFVRQEALEDGAKISIEFRTGGKEIQLPFKLNNVPVKG